MIALMFIGIGMIQNGRVANADDSNYYYSKKLVSNYKFEETSGTICVDSMGAYNGTYNGATSVTGADGNARSFNGTSDYINFRNKLIPIGKKSIQFKIKTTSKSNNMYIIDNCNGQSDAYGIYFTMESGKILTGIPKGTSGTANFGLHSNSIINDGKWHTVLFAWDGTVSTNSAKLYIDGKLESSATPSVNETNEASYNLYIGKPANTSKYFFEGQLDEIEIYNNLITGISLDKSTINLTEGDSQQLIATTTPAGAQVKWSSSDSSIATVDSTGKVTGLKEGNCTITATTADGLTATCVVTVTKKDEPKPDNPTQPTGDANLFIELVDGQIKQYSVSQDEINKFTSWFENRDKDHSLTATYKFNKGTYKDYVVHDQIDWFEVR
jgi:uncharacterized protein YjdB